MARVTWQEQTGNGRQGRSSLTRRQLLAVAAAITACPAYAAGEASMKHVVLLGDSIFDNAAYVAGEPDVVQQLLERLPRDGWRATLKAVDGSITSDIEHQLR